MEPNQEAVPSSEDTGEDTIEVTLTLPGPTEKGFLRRVREVNAILDMGNDGISGLFSMWEALADYLIAHGYVSVPDGVDPRDAILNLSQDELGRAAGALAGLNQPKTVNPPNGAA